MPIREVKKLIIVALMSQLLGGCVLFRPSPPQGLKVEMSRTTMTAEQFGELQIESIFVIKNSNKFDVEIIESERTIRVDAQPLDIRTDNLPRLVPAEGEIEIPAKFRVFGTMIVDTLKENPADGLVEAAFQLAVKANHRELEPNKWYAAEWNGPMLTMLSPTLSFIGIETNSLSALQADLHLNLDLDNPNNFQIHVRSITLDVTINDVPFGMIKSAEIDKGITVGGHIQLKVSKSYRLSGEGSQIFEVLSHAKEFRVEVKGAALLAFDSPLSPTETKLQANGNAKP